MTFYFDFGSPNAFLSQRVIPAIELRTGGKFTCVPVLLGGLFKLTGNQSPATAFEDVKNKLDYEYIEMRRFIARHAIDDFKFNPHSPINTLQLMRGAIAADQEGVFEPYVERVYADIWTRGLDMAKHDVAFSSLSAAGLPVERIFALSQSSEIKQRLLDNPQAASQKGAFGSPSILVGDELFFCKDRLRDVEQEVIRTMTASAS